MLGSERRRRKSKRRRRKKKRRSKTDHGYTHGVHSGLKTMQMVTVEDLNGLQNLWSTQSRVSAKGGK